MNFNDLILLLDSRTENLKHLALMEVPYKVDVVGNEYYKTKEGYRIEKAEGNIFWFDNKSRHHRIDGPAAEYADGTKYWFINGKRHRLDGPAVIKPDGSKAWFVNGKHHRIDGPAIEYHNGRKSWYVNDKPMSEQDFDKWRAKHNPIK